MFNDFCGDSSMAVCGTDLFPFCWYQKPASHADRTGQWNMKTADIIEGSLGHSQLFYIIPEGYFLHCKTCTVKVKERDRFNGLTFQKSFIKNLISINRQVSQRTGHCDPTWVNNESFLFSEFNLPTLSTPYLCPATWCESGTQPFRWAWPCGPSPLWPHFSSAGGPPESRWARFTLTAAEHGFNSSLPRAREDSITTWRCLDIGGKQTSLIKLNFFLFKIIHEVTLFFLILQCT